MIQLDLYVPIPRIGGTDLRDRTSNAARNAQRLTSDHETDRYENDKTTPPNVREWLLNDGKKLLGKRWRAWGCALPRFPSRGVIKSQTPRADEGAHPSRRKLSCQVTSEWYRTRSSVQVPGYPQLVHSADGGAGGTISCTSGAGSAGGAGGGGVSGAGSLGGVGSDGAGSPCGGGTSLPFAFGSTVS